MNGLHGDLLDVDLTDERIERYTIPEKWQRHHLGGRGVGIRVLLEEQSPGPSPRGQTDLLVFMTGPLTGTTTPGASRYWVGSRSRLHGGLGEAYAGGSFGHELARTGYDGIIIRGRGEPFTAIVIDDQTARIVDATDYWGMTVAECADRLAPTDGSCACIGPGGESFAGVASIVNDRNRVAAGGGLGTVMGDKRLKAIVVNGSSRPSIAHRDAFRQYRREFEESLRANDRLMTKGSSRRSFARGRYDRWSSANSVDRRIDEAGADADRELDSFVDMSITRDGCVNCPIKCKHVVTGSIDDESVETGGPDIRTSRMLADLLSTRDLESVALAHHRCNQYGLDAMGVGQAIATAAEFATVDTDDRETLLTLVENIAYAEKAGQALGHGAAEAKRYFDTYVDAPTRVPDPAQGTRGEPKASTRAIDISPDDKRSGCPATDFLDEPQQEDWDLPIRGGQDRSVPGEKAQAMITVENARCFVNSLVMCTRVAIPVGESRNYGHIRNLVAAVTDRSMSIEDTLRIGERNFMLGVLYDLRERAAAETTDRYDGFETPSTGHSSISNDRMREEYRNSRGVKADGVERAKLRELGLLGLAEECRL